MSRLQSLLLFYSLSACLLLAPSSWGQGASLQLEDPPVGGHFALYGAEAGGGNAGLPVASGDFNGDSNLDLAAAPFIADASVDGNVRINSGLVYVALGDGEISGYVDFASPPLDSAVVVGARPEDFAGSEIWNGDVNGDGTDDLLVCAQGADGPGNSRPGAGALYVVFGNPAFAGTIDLATPPAYVTRIHGAQQGDRVGIWVRSGDLNGDLIDDILVGADGVDGPLDNRPNAGAAYIIYGTDTWSATMDLASPPPGRTVLFHGVSPNDHFGATLNVADINGDDRPDVLVSSALRRLGAGFGGGSNSGGGDGPPGDFRFDAGESLVFFNPGEYPPEIDAASPVASVSLTIVYGAHAGDVEGEEVLGADLDNDGDDELIMGALTASPLGRGNAGAARILEGGKHLENRSIDLANPPDDFYLTTFYGGFAGDIAGDTMVEGDVDNDGFEDLILGSPCRGMSRGNSQGVVDVFFGRPEPFPEIIDLRAIPADVRSVQLIGPNPGDTMGYSMTSGDWDSDGYADPMPNAMRANGFGNLEVNAGDAHVVSGSVITSLAPTFTQTATFSNTPTVTNTPTPSPTFTPSETPTSSPTFTPTETQTPSPTATDTRSADLTNDGVVDAKDLLLLLERMSDE